MAGRQVPVLRIVAALSWLVPLLLLAVAGWEIWQQELHIAREHARSALGIISEEAEKVFEAQEMALRWVDDHTSGQNWDDIEHSADLHRFLSSLNKDSNYIDSIWLFDAAGNVRATTRAFPLVRRINVADRDYFRGAQSGGDGIHIGMPAAGRMTGTFAFHVARRRSAPGGAFNGVILLALSPGYFEKHFLTVADGDMSSVMLVRDDGAVLASGRGARPGSILPAANPYRQQLGSGSDTAAVFATRFAGRPVIAGIQRLRRYPVYVTYAIDLRGVRLELWDHLAVFSTVALACSIILFSASFGAVRIARSEQHALRGWQAELEQRQQMEAQMRLTSKLEALGRLAGGIAHHFNNLLPAMSGLLEQTLTEVPRNSTTAQRVGRMIDAVAQGRQLVRQILIFSRRDVPARHPISLAAIVEGAVALVRGNLPSNVVIQTTFQAAGDILGDEAQLQEVALNLLSNAIQAIGTGRDGCISIVVQETALDQAQARSLDLASGVYVLLTCGDNGPGMAPDVAERAFDPFFTTKPIGQGTGLGLAITHGIIAGHNGGIFIDSQFGRGTTVSIYLPKAEAPVENAPRAAAA